MEQQPSVVEYWTVTRRGLVLSGPRDEIETIACALRLPDNAPVEMTPSTATLALWGETLETYTRAFTKRECDDAPAEDGLTSESPAQFPAPNDD